MFREVKDVIKHKVQPKEPVKIEFELKEEESDDPDLNRNTIKYRDNHIHKDAV